LLFADGTALLLKVRPWMAGVLRMEPREAQAQKQENPARWPGFSSIRMQQRATAYPAGCSSSGRRARDVMPAAMRALVRTLAV
jgi:hypothetical protein